MANTPAVLPDPCPNHVGPIKWTYVSGFDMDYCAYLQGTPNWCHWGVNHWAEGSDSYANGEMRVAQWQTMWA